MADTIIQSLRDYFLKCPLMDNSQINVDFLPDKGVEFSINTMPGDEILKKYIGGDTIRQYLFTIQSIANYSSDVLQAIENSGFFEKLSDWLEAQNKKGNLPILPEDKETRKIEALSPGYLFVTSPTVGRYQIQCRIVYYQKG